MSRNLSKLQFVCVLLALSLIAPKAYGTAIDIPPEITPRQLNALVAMMATTNVVSVLIGIAPSVVRFGDVGRWTGSITDSGWDLTFSGSLTPGNPTSFRQTGVLDLQNGRASWTDVFPIGGGFEFPQQFGSGHIDFDPDWAQVIFDVSLAAGVSAICKVAPGKLCDAATLTAVGLSTAEANVIAGNWIGDAVSTMLGTGAAAELDSNFTGSVPRSDGGVRDVSTGASGTIFPDGSVDVHTFNEPEPATFILFGTGVVVLLVYRYQCERRRLKNTTSNA
jgi:hypothetical protein